MLPFPHVACIRSNHFTILILFIAILTLPACGLVGDDGGSSANETADDNDTPAWVGDWDVTERPDSDDTDYWVLDEQMITKVIDMQDSDAPEDCRRIDRTITDIEGDDLLTYEVDELGSVELGVTVTNSTLEATILDSYNEDAIGNEYTFSSADTLPFALDECVPIE